MRRCVLLAVGGLLFSSSVSAMQMKVAGDTVTLSGRIKAGDELNFLQLMKSPAGKFIRILNLDSGGGSILVAGEIAQYSRDNGLITVVNGAVAKCGSACTVIFAGGVRRHYINGLQLVDAVVNKRAFRGLGFHEGSDSLSLDKNRYSGRSSGQMIGFYHHFGISAAKDYVTKAGPNKMFQMSAVTALSLGIATSTARP